MMNAFDAWLKDKAQRETQTKYTPPPAQKGDATKKIDASTGFRWQTQLLKPLSVKTYGKTYEDKFNTSMKQLGVTDANEIANFKRWLNSRENTTFKHNSQRSTFQKNQQKAASSIFSDMNQTAENKAKQMDRIASMKVNSPYPETTSALNSQTQPETVSTVKKQAQPKQKNAFEKAMDAINSPLIGAYKNVLEPVENKVERFLVNANDGITMGQFKKNLDAGKKIGLDAPQFVREASKAPTNNFDKSIDIAGQFAGAAAPIGAAYKATALPAEGLYKALTLGKDLGKAGKYVNAAVKGGAAMGAYGTASEGLDELLHPNDATLGQRAKNVALDVGLGAVGDPALRLAGTAIKAGANKAVDAGLKKFIKGDVPAFSGNISPQAVNQVKPSQPKLMPELNPKPVELPKTDRNVTMNTADNQARLKEIQSKMNEIKPKVDEYQKEFDDAVQQQYEYLKNSMGKGVDRGTTSNGLDGNFKEVTGTYNVSKNPKWYQDFYKANGRKPNDAELRQLAEDHVKNGFQDELGSLPPWQSKKVQEIDDQIDEVTSMLRDMPDQREALQPILDALHEDRAITLKESNQAINEFSRLQKQHENAQRVLNGQPIKHTDTAPPKRSTKLEDIVNENGYKDVTPETIAKSYNNKTWYHGTGTANLKAENVDPLYGSHEGLFGHGVYLTDEPKIAEGYAKSRSKQTKTPVVYETNVKINKVLDLEKLPTNEAIHAFKKTMPALDAHYEMETGTKNYFTDLLNKWVKEGKTSEQIIQNLRSEIREFSHDAGISTSEFVGNFQDLTVHLKEAGYDGITHTGGARTKNEPHRVLILLDPHDAYSGTGRAGQITRFEPQKGVQAKKVEKAVKEVAATSEKLPKNVQAMQAETIPFRTPTGNKQFKELNLVGKAVNNTKKVLGSKNVIEKPITQQELLGSMKKNLGVVIRNGRMGNVPDAVKGYYKVDPEVIRSKVYGDVQVISHEIGHHLDKQFKLANPTFDRELMKLGASTSGKGYTPDQVREEGIAEYIRLFLTDPQKAAADAPSFSKHFETVLTPKVKRGLLRVQGDVDRWIEQGPVHQLGGKIDFTGKEQSSIGEKVDKIYSQFMDKFDRLKKVEKSVTGKVNDAANSLYKKARLSVGAPKKAEMILRDFKKILKQIEKYGYDMKDVSKYVTAVHAKELEDMGLKMADEAVQEAADITNAFKQKTPPKVLQKAISEFQSKYGVELNQTQLNALKAGKYLKLTKAQLTKIEIENRIESGMTKQQIDETINRYNTPEMNQVQQGIVAYNNKLLDMLKDGGVLSKEAIDSMRKRYPNYVPFYRFFEDDITHSLGGNKGFTNLTNPVKRLKGSTLNVIDPLESIVKNTFAVVNAVEKNKVGLELSKLADIEGSGRFIERLEGAQPVNKEHIVTVFEDGKKVQYQLDKDLYEAIQQLDEDRANKVIQFLSYPTSTLRAGATLTPEFMLRNPIRDQFHAYVVSNFGYNPVIDLPLGAWEVFKGKALNKDGLYKQWAKEGGGYGNYLSQDRNYLRETLDHVHKEGNMVQKGFKTIVNPKEWLKILQSMSEFSEESTKLGEYRNIVKKGQRLEKKEYKKQIKKGANPADALMLSKKKGISPQEAAYQSRDLMDFGRVGSDMKQWNRAVAFINANIQGKDRLARAFKSHPVRTTIKSVIGVTLPAIGSYVAMDLYANDKQKEIYDNTPKWLKDTFFILPIPGTDELARIPKPFDLAPVFANPVEQIMDYIKENDPDAWSDFLKRQAVSIIDIPHMLTGLTPLLENITNHSFFSGGPIVPRRDQDLLPADQYGVSTSLTARTIGKITNYSPYKVDNFIRGYGAGLGRYATSGSDKLLQTLNVGKLPPEEQKKWSELPVVNAFTVDTTGGGQVMTDFYNAIDKLTKERNSAKRNQSGYKEGDEVNYDRVDDYKYINKVSRQISDLRNEYRAAQSSYSMSPQDKRSKLDELDSKMNQLAREALIHIGERKR